jgi:hypothetical protein
MTHARLSARKSLAIPPSLKVVMLGVVALGCSSSSGGPTEPRDASVDVAPKDASFDGGACKIQVPDGDVCFTTCIAEALMPDAGNVPEACQTYCDLKTNLCYLEGGVQNFECDYSGPPDGNGQVLC